jgi:glycyl-tRNA synthetase beta subunit
MDRTEHKQILTDILGSLADTGKVSALLMQLSDDYNTQLALQESTAAQNTQLIADNQSLIETNSRLFLKVGEIPKKEEPAAEEEEGPTLESLFGPDGKLK